MSDTAEHWPIEPAIAGTEVDHLLGSLDRLRATFRWKAGGLDAAQLDTRVGASALTLGGLLKHLAGVEATRWTWAVFGEDPGAPWNAVDWEADPDWTFTSAAHDSPAELYQLYDDAVASARRRLAAAIADGGLDQLTRWEGGGQRASLRRHVCDVIEEYGRHTGHADLIREAIDGLVGEDPPEGWQP